MLALILAGGRGTRLGLSEKPLVLCAGRPMIGRVADALIGAGLEVVVVASPSTPYTQNWCRAHDLLCVCTAGAGYIEDLAEAAALLDLDEPVLCVSADLPGISPGVVAEIVRAYDRQPLPALSVWVAADDAGAAAAPFADLVEEVMAVPAGINILHGGRMGGPQEETRLLLADPGLCHNVNTREAHRAAEAFLASAETPPGADRADRKTDNDPGST